MTILSLTSLQIFFVGECVDKWLSLRPREGLAESEHWPTAEVALESPLLRRLLTGEETFSEVQYLIADIEKAEQMFLETERLEFALARISEWISICIKFNNWAPRCADGTHSVLLRRLLSGKPAFPKPPPKLHSSPNYELAEGKPVEVDFRDCGHTIYVSQCRDFSWYNKDKRILEHTLSGELYQLTGSILQKYPSADLQAPENHTVTCPMCGAKQLVHSSGCSECGEPLTFCP